MNRRPPWNVRGETGPSELPTLDALEAFDAMRTFLESYWTELGKSEDTLQLLLSDIDRNTAFRPDGGTLDPAEWGRWIKAVRDVKQG